MVIFRAHKLLEIFGKFSTCISAYTGTISKHSLFINHLQGLYKKKHTDLLFIKGPYQKLAVLFTGTISKLTYLLFLSGTVSKHLHFTGTISKLIYLLFSRSISKHLYFTGTISKRT